MEHLIKAFTRVTRKIDDADELIESFPALERSALSDPPSVTDKDRRRILDFPEPETQHSNIATASTLTKPDLLKRAAESPSELTTSEVDLLKERYWLDVTRTETNARASASSALLAVSQDHWREVTEQLKKVRASLYEEHEAKAMENAEWEAWRRMVEASKARRRQEAEGGLARARPWVRRLWEEDKGEKVWGYAVFVDPDVNGGRQEEYLSRRDAALFHATGAIGCGDTIGARWKLQRLDWPKAAAGGGEKSEDEGLAAKFDTLRERFKAIRDRAPKKQRTSPDVKAESGGLPDGILRNVLLVIDQDCVDSVLSESGTVDDMWVWAVDPDYEAGDASKDDQKDKYKGHLQVRLQQLVNNFFDARRFHEDDYSMEALWEAAQKARNKTFVSVKNAEAGLWKMSRDVGSALRP